MREKKDREKRGRKGKIRENLMSFMGVPEDVAYDLPTTTVVGNNKIEVDNYKNVVSFDMDNIKLNTTTGLITITGSDIFIKEVEAGRISVNGKIKSIIFDSI